MTVTMKLRPKIRAANLSLFLFIIMLLGAESSLAMSRIMAMTASQRLISERDNGKFKFNSINLKPP
ncbi:MAG: hypothetical protein QXY73_04040 [Candidatus Bathyarchaeia archaeon]